MSDLVDFGPLGALVGVWKGDKGVDLSPEKEGLEKHLYSETITIEEVGDVGNAGAQTLVVVRYHQVVAKLETGDVFHDETGYYMWDAERQVVMQSLVIPRGVSLLAGGDVKVSGEETTFSFSTEKEGYGVVQSPFMAEKANTRAFDHKITVKGSKMSYFETTTVDIYGRSFDHTDENELTRQD